MGTRGIVYVAWGQQHVDEAVISSHGSSYSKILFSDRVAPDFNGEVVIVPDMPQTRNIYMRRWFAIKWSTFDTTCLLDTDCIIHAPIDLGFDLAEEYGYANTIAPGLMFNWKGKDYVHYSGGIHFWRKGFLGEFFDRLYSFTENDDCFSDETAIGVVLRELKINPAVLPKSFLTIMCGRVHDRPIRVFHTYYPFQLNTLKCDGVGNDFAVWEGPANKDQPIDLTGAVWSKK